MANKLKFYIQLNGTIVNCAKIESVKEIIGINFNDLMEASKTHTLPLIITAEQSVIDKINTDVSKAVCSNYNMKTIKIYANSTLGKHCIEIKTA